MTTTAVKEGMQSVEQKLRSTNLIALDKAIMFSLCKLKFEDRARNCKYLTERLISAMELVRPLL